jgi:hypothetical protein
MPRRSALIPALFACAACPSPLEPPQAVISAGSSAELDAESSCEGDAELSSKVGVAAELHGACSRDPNGLTLTYHWQVVDQPNGSKIELPDAARISPTIVPDLAGRYVLSLIVSDGQLTSEPAFVTLRAQE